MVSSSKNIPSPNERKNTNSSRLKSYVKKSANSKKKSISPKHSPELHGKKSSNSPKKTA